MNSIKKVSQLPIKGSKIACAAGIASGTPSSSRNYAQAAVIRLDQMPRRACERESGDRQIVQLPCPTEFKNVMGIDKYFAEKRGSELIACAATKKLLAEEQLRRDLQGLRAPCNSIVREHWRSKPSILRPICPLAQDDL